MANDPKPSVSFVGVGRMGANMAMRLKDCGYDVKAVYDVYRESAEKSAAETGAKVATSLADVTASADVIITVVTDDKAMDAVFAESGDTLLTNAKGKIFINCATLTPAVHVKAERAAAKVGAYAIETLMASSITQAREGSLYLIVAGDEKIFEQIKPLLEAMSKSLTYTGKPGSAAQVKALINMVMNINTAGLAEGLGIADSLGLDLDMLRKVFSQTGANSRVLETDGEDMQKRDHETYFSAAHAAKDSHIAAELGHEAGLAIPLADATAKQYDRMIELGIGELDKSGIAELTFASRRGRNAA